MDLDLTPGKMGLRTAIRLGIARHNARMLTHTMAKNEDASSFSSRTMNTIPADERPNVKSNTVRQTTACLSEMHPQQHDVALLKHLRNLVSGLLIPASVLAWSSKGTGPWSIGTNS